MNKKHRSSKGPRNQISDEDSANDNLINSNDDSSKVMNNRQQNKKVGSSMCEFFFYLFLQFFIASTILIILDLTFAVGNGSCVITPVGGFTLRAWLIVDASTRLTVSLFILTLTILSMVYPSNNNWIPLSAACYDNLFYLLVRLVDCKICCHVYKNIVELQYQTNFEN